MSARATSLAALLVVVACDGRSPAPPSPFEGARPLAFESARAGKPLTPQEVERLVATTLEVAGGPGGSERLRKLSWRRVEDMALQVTGNPMGNQLLCTTLVRPDATLLTKLEYKNWETELRILFRGEQYLKTLMGQTMLATGPNQQFVEWDWEVARIPFLLSEAASLTPLPPRVEPGRTLLGLRVDVDDLEPKFEAWIDPAGPMVVEVQADLPLPTNPTRNHVVQRQLFSDFRRVGGVLFPFRRDLLIDDQRFGLAEAREIQVDVELKDDDFLPEALRPKPR